jgi:hypothetical protein
LRAGFQTLGYPLLSAVSAPPGVIEVYPHPAQWTQIVQLLDGEIAGASVSVEPEAGNTPIISAADPILDVRGVLARLGAVMAPATRA